VTWTTHLWTPEDLSGLLVRAGLELVVELRFPAGDTGREQVLLCAQRPD
jgi:hypothetical protein